MKRFVCCIILFALMISLTGCSSPSFDPVSFFYCRKPEEYQYFETDGVIASEVRDLTGHYGDLQYLVSLYLAGPLEEGLVCPFPRSTRLVAAAITNNTVHIELSDLGNVLTDSEFSLASACLAKTCILFTDSTAVTIKSGVRTITMNTQNIVLFDNAIPEATEGG